jgi:hypothetical protein
MNLKFSQDLETLLKELTERPLSLKEILQQTSERSFCLIIFLLSLPFLFPMPPGLTTILGSGSMILSLQMSIGRKSPWLPRKVAEFKFPRKFVLQLLNNLKKVTRILEKITRPRWINLAENVYIGRINGLCLAWLTFLLMLPVPLTNPLPAGIMVLLTVAMLEADGLLMSISYVLTFLLSLLFGFIGYALWQAPELLHNLGISFQ